MQSLYTTSIPTATDAGTYYVWYKVVGDENHSDTEAVCLPVTVSIDPDACASVTAGGKMAIYHSLEAAFEAANAAGKANPGETVTVTIYADITVTAPISVEADIVLDLNGHTVTRG